MINDVTLAFVGGLIGGVIGLVARKRGDDRAARFKMRKEWAKTTHIFESILEHYRAEDLSNGATGNIEARLFRAGLISAYETAVDHMKRREKSLWP